MRGRDVTRSLGPEAEDMHRVDAVAVATVEVESRIVADHREAYPGVWFRGGMREQGGMRERERGRMWKIQRPII
jgi:hypothetical protein